MEDSKIVELYLNRDEHAIKETSDKYGRVLRHISLNIVGDECDAEECENDTYLEAWKSIPPNNPASYLFSFLAKITRSRSINVCRRNNTLKRKAKVIELSKELEECLPSPSDEPCRLSDSEVGDIISRFLRMQKEEHRNVFLYRYWFAYSIAEIAKRFNMSESKVKSILFRMREKLKNFLESEGIEL